MSNLVLNYQNGRVVNITDKSYKRTELWDNLNKKKVEDNFQYQSMVGIQEPTLLNKVFFSKENLDLIQNMIRYNVYQKSTKQYVIGRQSDIEIQVIMRSIFLQHSPNLNYNIRQQVKYLNEMVTDWCVPKIIAEVEQYIGYVNDVEKLPMPIDLPQNLSSKGTKISRSITTTF